MLVRKGTTGRFLAGAAGAVRSRPEGPSGSTRWNDRSPSSGLLPASPGAAGRCRLVRQGSVSYQVSFSPFIGMFWLLVVVSLAARSPASFSSSWRSGRCPSSAMRPSAGSTPADLHRVRPLCDRLRPAPRRHLEAQKCGFWVATHKGEPRLLPAGAERQNERHEACGAGDRAVIEHEDLRSSAHVRRSLLEAMKSKAAVRRDRRAAADVALAWPAGELVGLVGPNGRAGKRRCSTALLGHPASRSGSGAARGPRLAGSDGGPPSGSTGFGAHVPAPRAALRDDRQGPPGGRGPGASRPARQFVPRPA